MHPKSNAHYYEKLIGEDMLWSKLEIDPATMGDQGIYACVANNEHGVMAKNFKAEYAYWMNLRSIGETRQFGFEARQEKEEELEVFKLTSLLLPGSRNFFRSSSAVLLTIYNKIRNFSSQCWN